MKMNLRNLNQKFSLLKDTTVKSLRMISVTALLKLEIVFKGASLLLYLLFKETLLELVSLPPGDGCRWPRAMGDALQEVVMTGRQRPSVTQYRHRQGLD